ncbi:MAG: type I-E CRISPR-associated protein Cse1/CasA [Acidobacteria bacterium]|nr:type I-E CRISPR-associated protein Cse1/CasA [Acidobacteriota bacterium]
MYSFNLIDKPWIPCIMADGSQQELNLKETLTKAHEIQEIFAQSPIVTVALYRLLLAVVYRNFPFKSLDEWEKHWKKQNFCQETIKDYFDKWHDRFDLFHSEWPFYQSSQPRKNSFSTKKLGWGFTAGNAARWFEHSWDDEENPISLSLATQWLLTSQAFAVSAGKSETLHTKNAPWTVGAIVLVQGDNLFQTLLLNLLNFYQLPFQTLEDKPIWEQEKLWEPKEGISPLGALDYLTLQSRSLYVFPGEFAKTCFFAQGLSLKEDFIDPMCVYYPDKQEGWLLWKLQEDKAVWRDSQTLFSLSSKTSNKLPLALNHIATLTYNDVLEKRRLYQIQVIGQFLKPPSTVIKFWRQERLPVPVDYLDEKNKELLDKLEQAIKLAENVAWKINSHLNKLAELLIASTSDQKEGRKPDSKDVKNLVTHFGGATQYWAQLEPPFKTLLVNLPEDQELDDNQDIIYGQNELKQWAGVLKKAATNTFLSITKSLDTSSHNLKAVAKVEDAFSKDINIALSPYLKKTKDQSA